MAQRTKAQLGSDITTYIKDNGGDNPLKTKGSEHRLLEQNIVDSMLAYEDETTQAVIQTEATTEANKFVSARRFWQGITRFLALAWTWAEKQIFSKGINLGNNTSPSANGDIWYNPTTHKIQARANGATVTLQDTPSFIASGNILYVSPNATDASGASIASDSWTRAQAIGREDRPFITLASANTAANNGDIIRIMSDVAGSQLTKDVTLVGNDRYTTLMGNFAMVNNIPGQRRIVLKNIRTTGTVTFSGAELVMNDCDVSFTSIGVNQGATTSIEAENTIFRNAIGTITTGNQPKFNNCVFKGNVQFDINTTPTPLATDRAFLQECIFEGNLTLSSNNTGAYMKECIVQGTTTVQVTSTYTREYKIYNCDLASLSVTGNGTAGVSKLKISNSVYSGTYTNTATNLATTTNNFINIPV